MIPPKRLLRPLRQLPVQKEELRATLAREEFEGNLQLMVSVGRWQRWWVDWWPHRWHIRWFVPRFLRSCPEPFRGEVLEVGSGSGFTSRRILETFPQVELTAVDIDPSTGGNIKRLKKKYGQRLNWSQADLMNIPFERERFDIVVAINVLQNIDDLQKATRQLIRVVRQGGLIGLGGGGSYWPEVRKILSEEGCDVLNSSTGFYSCLWIRKPYRSEAG